MKVVFFGTPQIAVLSLQSLIERTDVEVCAVITQPDKPAGRGNKLTPPPVKVVALENNIEVFQPVSIRKDADLINKLKTFNADFFITVAFGQILSQEVLDIPKIGTINLHASLLPKYRGANPIQRAIVNGDAVTGVTTMFTVLALDAGPMLMTEKIPISIDMTAVELAQKISEAGPNLLYNTMQGLLNGKIKPIEQNEAEVTFANKFTKEDGKINWNKPALDIHNLVRGLKPWPSTFTTFNNKIVKIIETKITYNTDSFDKTGEIIAITKAGIEVSTLKGTILITQIQPEGKKPMSAASWSNGAHAKVGDFFVQKETL